MLSSLMGYIHGSYSVSSMGFGEEEGWGLEIGGDSHFIFYDLK